MDFDNISEDDLLNALGDMSIDVKPSATTEETQVTNIPEELSNPEPISTQSSSATSLELNSGSIDAIAVLLKELMQNKTIEISIKIKD